MIIETIINAIVTLITSVFGLLPNIPSLPNLDMYITDTIGVLFGNLQLLGVFVDVDFIKVLFPIFLIVYNFEHIYHFVMFIIRKLPISTE